MMMFSVLAAFVGTQVLQRFGRMALLAAALTLALVVAYQVGAHSGKTKCREAQLQATINELHRQHAEGVAILEAAQKRSDLDAKAILSLNKKVENYVGELSKTDVCVLSGSDAHRLRQFR
jgi:lactam utilization protein B